MRERRGEERREEKREERRRGGLRCDVLSRAVLSCPVDIYIYIYIFIYCSKVVTFYNVFFLLHVAVSTTS